ncbi:MAG: UV damage endonuclease UvsE [Acidobacteriota bacterium]
MEAKPQRVSNNLGLVCITTSELVRYKRTTRKRLLSFPESEQAALLRTLYAANAGVLENAVDFCLANNIKLYRISSDVFQFSDEPFGREILSEFADRLKAVGERALQNGIRLVSHPDQFVVLSSDSEDVIANSVKILNMHANTMDMLGQPRSERATMMIHGGKGDRSDRLVDTILKLPEPVRSRIAFENDEYAYSSAEILDVCRRACVRMVFDAHHHVCHEKLDSFDDPSVDEAFWAARETWNDPENQLVHISNGREHFNDRAHSDLIATMPSVYRFAPWIEVEAKHKELAISKLTDEWI